MAEIIASADPSKFMDSLRDDLLKNRQVQSPNQKEQSDARKKELFAKMDRMQYVEHHQKQNKKKVNNS